MDPITLSFVVPVGTCTVLLTIFFVVDYVMDSRNQSKLRAAKRTK